MQRRLLLTYAGFASVLAAVAGLMWLDARTQRHEAERQTIEAKEQGKRAERARDEAEIATLATQGSRASALALVPERASEALHLSIQEVGMNSQKCRSLPPQLFRGLVDSIAATGYMIPDRHELAGHRKPVTSVAYSPDGTRILTAGQDGSTWLWDAESLSRVVSYDTVKPVFRDHLVTASSFSPDGGRVVIPTKDRAAIVVDAKSRQRAVPPLGAHRCRHVRGLRGEWLADPHGRWRRGRIGPAMGRRGGEAHRDVPGHGVVLFAALSPDGKTVASGGQNEALLLWNAEVARGEAFKIQSEHETHVRRILARRPLPHGEHRVWRRIHLGPEDEENHAQRRRHEAGPCALVLCAGDGVGRAVRSWR